MLECFLGNPGKFPRFSFDMVDAPEAKSCVMIDIDKVKKDDNPSRTPLGPTRDKEKGAETVKKGGERVKLIRWKGAGIKERGGGRES